MQVCLFFHILLNDLKAALESITNWKRDTIHDALEVVVNNVEEGLGKVAIPVHFAVTGSAQSLD